MPRQLPLLYRFVIHITHDRKDYSYIIVRTYETNQVEHYLLTAKNKTLLFRSDRPLWRNKGVNHRRFEMKLIGGECRNISFLEVIIEAMKNHIKWYEEFNPDYKHPKNNLDDYNFDHLK